MQEVKGWISPAINSRAMTLSPPIKNSKQTLRGIVFMGNMGWQPLQGLVCLKAIPEQKVIPESGPPSEIDRGLPVLAVAFLMVCNPPRTCVMPTLAGSSCPVLRSLSWNPALRG